MILLEIIYSACMILLEIIYSAYMILLDLYSKATFLWVAPSFKSHEIC